MSHETDLKNRLKEIIFEVGEIWMRHDQRDQSQI